MTNQQDFQNIIEQLRSDTDPVTAMRCLVIQSGGHWADVNDNNLFEINFLGIAGLGYGAADAVAKWIENARRTNAVDTAA
jgi:hypothetical protein